MASLTSQKTPCYLITGAAGFIGNRLCEKLMAQKAYVKAILRKPLNTTELDKATWNESLIFDLQDLLIDKKNKEDDIENNQTAKFRNILRGVDTIFHLAGVAHTQHISDEIYQTQNVEVTQKLLEMAAEENVNTFIYFSSIKAREVEDAYGKSKLAAENLVLDWGLHYNRSVCILRPVLVYGPGMKGNLAQMIKGIKKGWFPPMPETHNARSLVCLEDVVDAAICVEQKIALANRNTYIIAEKKVYSSREIYNLMREALKLPPVKLSAPLWMWKFAALCGDILEKITGWRLPMNSLVLQKLFGSSQYAATQLEHELGWKAKGDLLVILKQIADKL